MKPSYFYMLFINRIVNSEKLFNDDDLERFDIILKSICKDLIMGFNIDIKIKEDALEFVEAILNANLPDNEITKDFLFSLNFILADYLEKMNLGRPTLLSSLNNQKEPVFEVIFDENNKIITCDSTKMNELNEVLTLLKIVKMEKDKKQGPIPLVRLRYKKYN